MKTLAKEREIPPSQLKIDLAVLHRRKMILVKNSVVSNTPLGREIAKEEIEQRRFDIERMLEMIPYPKRQRFKKGIIIFAEAMQQTGLA